ncbi:Uu.00g122870.m01.CDS01 [Anthostomella pinea]|uniref:Uu.00g122870.m01.CDS01 n=1 Tax=Anthostomella pinea TaxID=933095 RepID=A0AAI8VHB7_9PEZI|nr:Uu.00g122870.m01.CDS01 [Anthostomella pinea]
MSKKTRHTEPVARAGFSTDTGTSTPTGVPSDDTKALGAPTPPPDGGLAAWTQVVGSWCVLFCTFGLVNTFGVYQTYYERTLTTVSSSSISWVGSIQGCLLLCGGLISGPLFDAGYFRHLLCTGLFLVIFGQFMTSLCTEFWQIVLAQGLCIGTGCGIVFLPCTAIMSQYFSRRRALATGLSSMGSPVAGIVLPIVFSQLQPKIGAPWATRVIAFILLGIAIVPLTFMRTRLPPSKHHRALVDTGAFRDMTFMTFLAGCVCAFMALYIPFFYIELFALDHRSVPTGFSSSYMVTLMNAGSIVGRVAPPYLADKTGQPCLIMAFSALGCSVLAFGWLGIRDFGGLAAFTVLYGIISGGVVSMQPVATFRFTHDMSKVGTRLGMCCFAAGIALLVGNPIAGVVLGDASEARWRGVIGFTADFMLAACGLLFVAAWFAMRAERALK